MMDVSTLRVMEADSAESESPPALLNVCQQEVRRAGAGEPAATKDSHISW